MSGIINRRMGPEMRKEWVRGRGRGERYRSPAATNPGGDYAYIACHRRTKGVTRPRPCVSRSRMASGRGGVRKGMFYNEPNQRRALTLAARTNGGSVVRAWRNDTVAAIEFPHFQIPARGNVSFGFIARMPKINCRSHPTFSGDGRV